MPITKIPGREIAPYEDIYNVLVEESLEASLKHNNCPLPGVEEDKLKDRLQITPNLFFPQPKTWNIILQRMENWKWISKHKGLDGRAYYLPQDYEKK